MGSFQGISDAVHLSYSAARATTLVNIARALGLELMFIPQSMVPAVNALLQPHDCDEDLPAFVSSSDGDADA